MLVGILKSVLKSHPDGAGLSFKEMCRGYRSHGDKPVAIIPSSMTSVFQRRLVSGSIL